LQDDGSTGENLVADIDSKKKNKRLSKGMRTHIRKMKQEARKAGMVYRPEILTYIP
jgi:hypothetical protein